MSTLDRLLSLLGLGFELDLTPTLFDAITPDLLLGARPGPEHVPLLREAGVTEVVSCLPPSEAAAMGFLASSFRTRFLPLHDSIDQTLDAALPAFFEVVDRPDTRIFVHCEVGVSRSASLVIAQVMRSRTMRFYEAYGAVRERRPQVRPNLGFATALQRFEHTLVGPRPSGELASLARYLHEVCRVPAEPALLHGLLEDHDYDAVAAIQAAFGGEVPRVVQGVRRG